MTKVRRRLFILIAAIAVGLGAGVAVWLRPAGLAPPDNNLEAVVLPDLEGRARTLAEWKGETLLINFWATWCAPCREEIPLLKDVQTRHASRGLQVVGIAIDEVADAVAYNRAMQMNYPVLIADLDTFSLMARYGNRSGALPYTVILDTNGRMIAQKLGAYRADELEATVERALTSAR